jgi:hypothetical protein
MFTFQFAYRLGIDDGMLEKLEEEAEYAAAKAELEELRNTAMDRIDTYNRKYGSAFCCVYGMLETF